VSQSKTETANPTEPWILLSFYFLFDNQHLYNDVYAELEILYADFNYPEALAPLIRCLLNNWKAALSRYKKLFAEQHNPQ